MKIWLLLLCLTGLHAQITPGLFIPNQTEYNDLLLNIVRRQIQGTVTITNTGVTLHIFAAPRPIQVQEQINQNNLADILIQENIVSLTKAQIESTGSLTGNLTITAVPNPAAPTGYVVQLFIYVIQLNLNTYSQNYFQFQANFISINPALPSTGSTPVFFTFPGTKLWLRLPEGGVISQVNTTDRIITSPATSATLPISIGSSAIAQLPNGTYFFSLLAAMNPTAPPPNQQLQTITLNNLIATINANLSNVNSLVSLTPAQTQNLLNNRALLQSLLTQ